MNPRRRYILRQKAIEARKAAAAASAVPEVVEPPAPTPEPVTEVIEPLTAIIEPEVKPKPQRSSRSRSKRATSKKE
jgi:hypothetical protein